MSTATGQYYDPTIPEVYSSYQAIRYLHPNMSLPKNKDLPSLNLYQIFYTTPPEDEGYYASFKQWPELNEELGIYEQAWELLPIPVDPDPPA